MSGGGYRLTGLSLPVEGTMAGGSYQLLGVASPAATCTGCCCTFLPCVWGSR